MSDTFVCAVCKGEFNKSWTEEEAVAEAHELFGPQAMEDAEVVCDDCFKAMGLDKLKERR